MSIAQSLSEICLRYPELVGIHPSINPEQALHLLGQAVRLAMQVPFRWSHIDRPEDGSTYLMFMVPQQQVFPIDGIRYQEQETRYSMRMGATAELEVCEIKFGFIPNSDDTSASRIRRRFRLLRGGHPQLVLVHYSRGPASPITPMLLNQPVRQYPLRAINEPATFVIGEKQGQKVFPNAPGMPPPQSMPGAAGYANMPGMQNMAMAQHNTHMMTTQQRGELEALQRRQRDTRAAHPADGQYRYEDDDSGDEQEMTNLRTLALDRYTRNHNLMNEVFMYAGLRNRQPSPFPDPYECFKSISIESKVAKLREEVDTLKSRAAARKEEMARLTGDSDGADMMDVSMQSLGPMSEGVQA